MRRAGRDSGALRDGEIDALCDLQSLRLVLWFHPKVGGRPIKSQNVAGNDVMEWRIRMRRGEGKPEQRRTLVRVREIDPVGRLTAVVAGHGAGVFVRTDRGVDRKST